MKNENLKETVKNLSIVNMLKTKIGYVLVTEDSSRIGEQDKYDGWLLLDQMDFYFSTEVPEADFESVDDERDGKEIIPADRDELYRRLMNYRDFRDFMSCVMTDGIEFFATNSDGSKAKGIKIGIINK